MTADKTSVTFQEFTMVIRAITERAALAETRFGVAAHDIGDGLATYKDNAQQIFAGTSTTKSLLSAYAPVLRFHDFRFRTRIVRCGTLDDSGTLHGDINLVASGDPNVSGRVTSHDTLDCQDLDCSYAEFKARPVGRSPLQVIERFALGVRDADIRRVTGTVLVDIQFVGGAYANPAFSPR